MLKGEIQDCGVYRFTIEDGVKGDKGLSAYEVAVQEGFFGTIDEWLESLVGPPVPVAQELGDDPDLAVSQKLLKDSIDSMEQSNSEAVAEAERLNNLSQQAASSAAESESNASNYAESANSSALSADQSASESEASAEQSLQSASSSESSAQSAANSAQSASESASSAGVSAEHASLAAVAADGSASKAKQSELSAIGSAERSEAGANSASSSATQAEQSAQSAASSAQSATDSADLAAASALAAKASEDSAKGSAEQAESSAKRADAVAETVGDKFDKSKVVGELGDKDDLVINQARVTLELNTLYRQIELLTAWSGHEIPKQPLYADFIGRRYAKDGKPCRFEDIFELTRLSKAWQFEQGKLEEYEVNEPRFSEKGLLIEPEHQNRFPTTLFSKVSSLDKTQVVDDYFLSNSFKSTKLIGVTQDVEDKTNGYWYKSRVNVSREDASHAVKRLGIFIDASNAESIRYVRFSTYSLFQHSHRFPAIVDVKSGDILYDSNNVNLLDISVNRIGGAVYIGFTSNGVTPVYATISVQFGLEGDDWEDVSTWRALPEGEEIILSCPQWINDFDKPLLSVIPSVSTPTTRLPDTLKVSHTGDVEVEADEGIQVNGNEITGFGYIRKLEVK